MGRIDRNGSAHSGAAGGTGQKKARPPWRLFFTDTQMQTVKQEKRTMGKPALPEYPCRGAHDGDLT